MADCVVLAGGDLGHGFGHFGATVSDLRYDCAPRSVQNGSNVGCVQEGAFTAFDLERVRIRTGNEGPAFG